MLKAERGLRAVARGPIWRRNDNRRLHRQEQETLRYRERPSTIGLLSIEVAVVILSQVMSTALKQPDDTLCGEKVDIGSATNLPTLGRRFSDWLRRLLDHGQLHLLFIFETDFFERLKNSVLIHRINGSCHK